jgi:hypothetical protein
MASPALGYQWNLDGKAIVNATVSTYTPVEGDEAHQLSVTVSYTDDDGVTTSKTSTAVTVGEDPNAKVTVTAPTLSGANENVAINAATLGAAVIDTENASPALGYQWNLDGKAIANATVSTYTPVEGDEAHQLSVT